MKYCSPRDSEIVQEWTVGIWEQLVRGSGIADCEMGIADSRQNLNLESSEIAGWEMGTVDSH